MINDFWDKLFDTKCKPKCFYCQHFLLTWCLHPDRYIFEKFGCKEEDYQTRMYDIYGSLRPGDYVHLIDYLEWQYDYNEYYCSKIIQKMQRRRSTDR